ncbi:MAG: hypothetical protein IT436_00735 [Phycisphaerales bacterium]|nr:hypothetical protein [Phycisphaerales bacterium]
MRASAVRIPIGLMVRLAGLAVALAPTTALGQSALGGGNGLQRDFNRYGGGAFTRSGVGSNAINNAIIYGNAPNGMSFQGRRGFGNPYEFQGRLGSNQITRFERDSLSSRAPSFGVNAAQIANYQRSLMSGGGPSPGIGGSLAVARNPYTAQQGLSPSLGYKTATSPYKPSQTTQSAAGGLFGVDPFGRTRGGMQRDIGLTDIDPASGVRKVTPGGLGGERNLMRDLTTQLSSGLTRQAPAPRSGLLDNPVGGLLDRPAGSTPSGSPRGTGAGGSAIPGVGNGVPGASDQEGESPFGPGLRTGLNSALKAGTGYDKAVLAQASNAEGWRQQQTATGLTGVQVRTQAPAGLRPPGTERGATGGTGATGATGVTGQDRGVPGGNRGLGGPAGATNPAGEDIGKLPPLGGERVDTSAKPRTAYELLRDRMTKRSEETRESRADGSDLLTYTLGKREAGGLTGLNEKDVLGMPNTALANPGSQGLSGSELTTLPGMGQRGVPEWERRIQDLRQRLRQQAAVDSTKNYLAAVRENAKETQIGGLQIPNYIQPKTGPTVNLWGKTDRPLPGLTPGTQEPKVTKGVQHGLKLDTTTLRLIRESGGKIESFINMGAPATDQFKEFMLTGQAAMREGKYFDAEDAFARAMNEPSADITAMVARTHAQIGAGLIVSAGSNLVKTFTEYPETAAPRYAPDLLPKESRLLALSEQLRAYAKEDTDVGRSSGLLLAYIGYQRGDQAAVAEGLDAMARVGRIQFEKAAPGADRDILEDEGRLVEFLRGVWQAP